MTASVVTAWTMCVPVVSILSWLMDVQQLAGAWCTSTAG